MPRGIPKWAEKLTKAQRKHLRVDAGCRTLQQVKSTFKKHSEWRMAHPEPMDEPCWDCWEIQQALGLNRVDVKHEVTINRVGGLSINGTHYGPSTHVARFLRGLLTK